MLRIFRMFVVLLPVMLLTACSLSTEVQLTPLAPQPVSTQSPLPRLLRVSAHLQVCQYLPELRPLCARLLTIWRPSSR
jgi:hypothetical protein